MTGKSLILLCIAFGIAAGSCIQVPQYQYELRSSPVVSAQVVSSPVVSNQLISSPLVQMSENNLYRAGVYGGNLVSAGSAIATDGPETAPLPVIQAPSVTLPAVESPVVALPSQPVPAPRVISQRCVCTKTVVKPQVIQRQVTVPKVQRYLKRTVTPVVENVSYKTRPVSSQSYGSSVASAPAVGSSPVAYAQGNCYSRIC